MAVRMFHTPLGWMAAAVRDGELAAVILPAGDPDSVRAALAAQGLAETTNGGSALLDRLEADLARYFAGRAVDFADYPVDLTRLSPFQRAALGAVRRLPAGEVRSYAWVAAQAGNVRACRAAGQAMHANPAPLVIPCHRVVASDGALTGFGGGVALKRALLAHEGVRLDGERVVLAWGNRPERPSERPSCDC